MQQLNPRGTTMVLGELFRPPLPLCSQTNNMQRWIAGLFAFSIGWSDMVLLPYEVQFTRPLVIVAVFLWLFSSSGVGNCVRPANCVLYAMLIFILFVPANFLATEDPARTARRVLAYFGLFLMTVLIHQTTRSWQAHAFTLKCLVAGCTVAIAGQAWNVVNGVVQGDGRYSAPGFDPNDLGAQIALSIPIASYLAFKGPNRTCFWLYLPMAVLSVLLTASRAGMAILALVGLYPTITLVLSAKHRKPGIIAAVLLSSIGAFYAIPRVSLQRVSTIWEELDRRDLNGRFAVWDNGMDLFWEHPVVGIGAGAFSTAVNGGNQIAAHNSYLEILVEHGVAGLLLFLLIILSLFLRVRHFPTNERMLWWTVLGGLTVLIATLSWENREMMWLLWALSTSFVPPSTDNLCKEGLL